MTRRLILPLCLTALLAAQPAMAAEPDPKLGKTALVNAVSGTVKIKEKGGAGFRSLSRSPELVPMGSIIDAKRGKVRVRAAGKGRGFDEGTFWKGDFELDYDREDARNELTLQGELGGGACGARDGAGRAAGVPRLWGSSDDPFKTIGWFSGAEVEEKGTKWLIEDLCDATRTVVKSGAVRGFAGDVLSMRVDAGATIKHFCDYDGLEGVSAAFCSALMHAPDLGTWGAGLVNRGSAPSYELCVTNPAGEETCKTYPFSEPVGPQGLRDSVVSCIADSGPGAYAVRWLIDGVQLGPSQAFTINAPPGQDCIQRP